MEYWYGVHCLDLCWQQINQPKVRNNAFVVCFGIGRYGMFFHSNMEYNKLDPPRISEKTRTAP